MVLPLFWVSAASQALNFVAEIGQAKDTNEFLEAVKRAQEQNAAARTASEVEGLTARAVQTRKATAQRLDQLQRLSRQGLAATQASAGSAGVVGSTSGDAASALKARVSEKFATDLQNLQGDEEQIQRMLEAVPINQANAVEAVQGVSPPSFAGASMGILGSYFEIKAKYGP